ncbi:hypothetical protein N658DRAFT_104373 [Parathielavia hyrcaniae]|uniref:Uncharacterized protein n=1 Tax=Parathielavia hyrcaniae TaxID=113614 RepID=A0AAN6T0X7_9PEZI|nr:hypothetical protein N658DRAFT_104373 [Parathielavia hyrcaniae]
MMEPRSLVRPEPGSQCVPARQARQRRGGTSAHKRFQEGGLTGLSVRRHDVASQTSPGRSSRCAKRLFLRVEFPFCSHGFLCSPSQAAVARGAEAFATWHRSIRGSEKSSITPHLFPFVLPSTPESGRTFDVGADMPKVGHGTYRPTGTRLSAVVSLPGRPLRVAPAPVMSSDMLDLLRACATSFIGSCCFT